VSFSKRSTRTLRFALLFGSIACSAFFFLSSLEVTSKYDDVTDTSSLIKQSAFNETCKEKNDPNSVAGYLAYQKYFVVANGSCGVHNPVPPNNPDKGLYHEEQYSLRPWSLLEDAFSPVEGLKACETVAEIEKALLTGKRTWDFDASNMSGDALELIPSKFVSGHCYLDYVSAEDSCDVLSKYYRILFLGDSILRHIQQAFWMSISGDFVLGGIPRSDRKIPARLRDICRCDGQFAGDNGCRFIGELPFLKDGNIRSQGYCPNLLNESATVSVEYLPAKKEVTNLTISALEGFCSPDPRPRVLVFQGGLHKRVSAKQFINQMAEPILNTLLNVMSTCQGKFPVHVIWIGSTLQSEALNSVYLNQRAEAFQKFDEEINPYLASKLEGTGINLINLHYRSISTNAPTADGVHKLSAANLYIAQAILSVLKFSALQ
jgi:hypothetical protein